MDRDKILDAASAAVREAERRSGGDPPDRRFDVPLAMLEDLAEELALPDPTNRETRGWPMPQRARETLPEGFSWCPEHHRYDLCAIGVEA